MLLKKILYSSLLGLFMSSNVNAEINPPPLQIKHQHPLLIKKNNIKKNEDVSGLKDGLYEFKIKPTGYPEIFYFYRILIINEDKFPEFKDQFSAGNIIPTPVSYSWNGDSYEIEDAYYLWYIYTDYKTDKPVIWISGQYGFGHKIVLEFNSESSGNEIYYDQDNIKHKLGTFQLTKFTQLDDINLDYIRYQAKIKKVDTSNFPDNVPCPQKDYEGIAGFIKIPKILADTANGWMVGLNVKHDKCSVHIAQSLAGNFKNVLIVKDSFVSFMVSRENSTSSAGYINKLTYIDRYPDTNQQVSGKIYLSAPYAKKTKTLNLEMHK